MERAALLSEFRGKVDEFDKFQGFIEKAKSQQGKFAAAVVGKVINDNTEKCAKVAAELSPLVPELERVVSEFGTARQAVLDGRGASELALQELELRVAIGEIDDATFESESASLKASIDSIDTRVAEIDAEFSEFQALQERWTALVEKSGLAKPVKKAAPAPAPKVDPVTEVAATPAERRATVPKPEPDDSELDAFSAEEVHDAPSGRKPVAVDDLSALGDDDGSPEPVSEPNSTSNEMDILGDSDEDEIPASEDEVEGDGEDDASEVPAEAGGEDFRRAVLLYQEGTAEEQIYPFNGDTMTLGRGRDNDIQVKNDSKVSRYHCKLYRRGPNFYIEDNKSANGTLVNGELITERRLFGGEEVIIGETFFRFRIMD